jgi:hypothetical protein
MSVKSASAQTLSEAKRRPPRQRPPKSRKSTSNGDGSLTCRASARSRTGELSSGASAAAASAAESSKAVAATIRTVPSDPGSTSGGAGASRRVNSTVGVSAFTTSDVHSATGSSSESG